MRALQSPPAHTSSDIYLSLFLKNLKRVEAPTFFRPATAMNSFGEDTVIMAYDATNGIARDKSDILNDK